MKALKMFSIPIKGLGIGKHRFDYTVNGEFFKHFEDSEISACDYRVDIILDKQPRMMELIFQIEGSFKSQCDRCLEEIMIPTSSEDRLLVKIGTAEEGDNEEVVYIDENEQNFDFSSYIYEFIHLSKPLQNVKDCEADDYEDCDLDVLDMMESEEKIEKSNPIWDDLKNIELG